MWVLKYWSCFFFSISTPTQSHAAPKPQTPDIGNSCVASKSATEGRNLQNSSHDICNFQSVVEINPTQVNSESAALNNYFQAGFQGEDSDDEDEELAGVVDNDEDSYIVDNAKTHDALAWADNFILKTRRRGGRQTENSVLKQWKVRQNHKRSSSIPCSLHRFSHGHPRQSTQDNCPTLLSTQIIQSNILNMLQLVNYSIPGVKRRGQLTGSPQYVSIIQEFVLVLTYYVLKSSLKKIMTMLGRVRRRQEDENLEICTSRPAKTSRTEDFYKAVMVQSQRLRLEYVPGPYYIKLSCWNIKQKPEFWYHKRYNSGLGTPPRTLQRGYSSNISRS